MIGTSGIVSYPKWDGQNSIWTYSDYERIVKIHIKTYKGILLKQSQQLITLFGVNLSSMIR